MQILWQNGKWNISFAIPISSTLRLHIKCWAKSYKPSAIDLLKNLNSLNIMMSGLCCSTINKSERVAKDIKLKCPSFSISNETLLYLMKVQSSTASNRTNISIECGNFINLLEKFFGILKFFSSMRQQTKVS